MKWSTIKLSLFYSGINLAKEFCEKNSIECPAIMQVEKPNWNINSCAFYRPSLGVRICLELCTSPTNLRGWSWPGSISDREPFGVICHEIGHHVDWLHGHKKYSYSSDFSEKFRKEVREPPLTSYCDNDAEWFAEMFRLFLSNPDLLLLLRPKTHKLMDYYFDSVVNEDWRTRLGSNVPRKIIDHCERQIEKRRPTSRTERLL